LYYQYLKTATKVRIINYLVVIAVTGVMSEAMNGPGQHSSSLIIVLIRVAAIFAIWRWSPDEPKK
jgi:hypothetical protein